MDREGKRKRHRDKDRDTETERQRERERERERERDRHRETMKSRTCMTRSTSSPDLENNFHFIPHELSERSTTARRRLKRPGG